MATACFINTQLALRFAEIHYEILVNFHTILYDLSVAKGCCGWPVFYGFSMKPNFIGSSNNHVCH